MVDLSIIIPVYNVEKYLQQCVDSVLREAPENSEIILVDDGSPDRCPEICDDYSDQDSRIRVIHKKNSGLSGARNAGLDAATGEYIFFIDSDDYLEYGYFDNILNQRDDVVIGSFVAFYQNNLPDYSLTLESKNYETLHDYLADFHFYFPVTFNTAWGKLYRRSIIEDNHLRFQEGIFMVEDILFNLEYYPYCKRISYMNTAILRYRQTDGTLSRKIHPDLFKWYEESYLKIKYLLEQQNVFNEENSKLFYEKAFGNTVECLVNAARVAKDTLKELSRQVCNSNLAVQAAVYNNNKKTILISTALKMKNAILLRMSVNLYVAALSIKAIWRKIK